MKKLSILLALCVAFSLAAVAQSESSSGSSQGSTGASSSDQTTTTKTTKKSKKSSTSEMGAAKEHTVTGCLSGPNDEGVYVLKNGRYKKGLEVGGNDELKNHVGHKVKLTGTWASEADMGAQESTSEAKESKSEAKEKHMKVSKIDHIADTCKMVKSGKTKKENSSTSAPPSM